MAPRYDLNSDFRNYDSLASFSPAWVIGVCRFANQVTFDLRTKKSVSNDAQFAMAEREPLVLPNVTSMSVTTSKGSHVSTMQFALVTNRNLLVDIMPGDWVVGSMLHHEDEMRRVAQRMRDKLPVNGWNDGLKFIGRVVAGPRKQVRIGPDGTLQTMYVATCAGFSELDAQMFYNPAVQRDGKLPDTMAAFGLLMENIVRGKAGVEFEGGSIDINLVLPALLKACFGAGAWSGYNPEVGGSQASPNKAYLVPQTVMKWMGAEGDKYSDLLRPMLGIQHYSRTASASDLSVKEEKWSLFEPDYLTVDGNVYRTNSQLVGLFLPSPPQFDNTVWGLLETYRNHPINEMFVTLRADAKAKGAIHPFLVVRQVPYSTDAATVAEVLQRDADDEHKEDATTKLATLGGVLPETTIVATPRADFTNFLELPRWVVDSRLLAGLDVGRTDATRFNYVHLTGIGPNAAVDVTGSFVRAPPNQDALDILRNGLRPYRTTLGAYWRGGDVFNGPASWRDLMTDVMMGQHLMLSGTISTYGILPPVAVGDNLEFENVVYHIEQVSHNCGIDPSGQRHWTTDFQLSYGVLTESSRDASAGRSGAFAGTREGEPLATNLPVTEE